MRKTRKLSKEKEPATVKAASAISERVFAHKLTRRIKQYGRACLRFVTKKSGLSYAVVAVWTLFVALPELVVILLSVGIGRESNPPIAARCDETPPVIFHMRFLLEVAVVAALITLGWSKPFRDRFFTTPSTAASSPVATPSDRTSHYVPRATPNPRNGERMRQRRSALDRRGHNNGTQNVAPSATPTQTPPLRP